MHPFEAYLKQQHLDALTVSIAAQVRYLTVWRATRGQPIRPEHAMMIRQSIIYGTGAPYSGPLTLTEPESVDRMPTLPIKRIHKYNLI